ncbi:MAG: hypothetical protein ACFFDO_04495 [Candidatus Thorarchaeota archaeon]
MKMRLYDLEKGIEKILNSNQLTVKSRVLFLLATNDQLSYNDIKKRVKTSKRWLESVIKSLLKDKIIAYNSTNSTYLLLY